MPDASFTHHLPVLHDKDIREPLFEYLEEMYGKIRIIEEKSMGKSRADIVMVREGSVSGIEIKSDADTYARLERQVKDYDIYYDTNMVVVGSRHAARIAEHVPAWWGILSVEMIGERMDFYRLREMTQNPKRKLDKKLSILWRPELAHLQEVFGLPKYKDKSKACVMEKIIAKVPEEPLARQISEELFERDYSMIADQITKFREEQGQKPRTTRSRRKRLGR